jgi:hypothetical protein
VVAAQAEVGMKTNEVPMAMAMMLGQIDLHGKLVTAGARKWSGPVSSQRVIWRVFGTAGAAPAAASARRNGRTWR